jgi:TusA-related sulfurtransferase
MACPKPVLMSKKTIGKMEVGQVLEILTTDPGSKRDIPAWANLTGQELISAEDSSQNEFRFIVKKGIK